MHGPFVILRPLTRGDEDDQSAKLGRQYRFVAQVVAHGFGAQHDFGAAQKRHEGAEDSGAAAGGELISGFLLLGRHLFGRDLRHAVLRSGDGDEGEEHEQRQRQ